MGLEYRKELVDSCISRKIIMKETIVLHAWEMITRFPSLKKLNFFPSFIGMLWLFLILIYQITFTYVTVFNKKDVFFSALADFIHKDYFLEVLIVFGVLFLLYIFIAPLAEWGIIEMIHSYRKSDGKKVHRTFQGLFDGFRHFLPLFEAHNVISVFRPLAIITFYILLLRIFGKTFFVPITYIMSGYLIFAFFLNMCFAYASFFIIFENKWAITALSASTGMAVRHINITMHLYYTMMLLYLRTILVALFFLVLPFVISSIIAFFTIIEVRIFLLSIFGIISCIFFIVIVHLNSTLEIFVEATWYEAYMICMAEDEEDGIYDDHHSDHGNSHHPEDTRSSGGHNWAQHDTSHDHH